MSGKLRSVVVGTGTVGEWHVEMLASGILPGAVLTAICDTQVDRANTVATKRNLNIPIYADEAEMLRAEKPDVVHVCTPSGEHFDPVVMAMEAGANVIVEKPMEIQIDRIDRMAEIAAKSRVRIAGIFQNRWNSANQAIKAAVDAGRFGTLSFAGVYTPWYRTDAYYIEKGGWRGTWKLDGGGAIMNQSVHAIDLLQWIVGPIDCVSAYGSSRIHPSIETEDTMACSLRFKNGAFGMIMGSTAMYPGGAVRLEIGGSDGTAVSESGMKMFSFRNELPGDAEVIKPITGIDAGSNPAAVMLDLHTKNIQAIHEAWNAGRDAETAPSEARKAVAIIQAMYESNRNGGASVQVK